MILVLCIVCFVLGYICGKGGNNTPFYTPRY